jgi:hypothetical protein
MRPAATATATAAAIKPFVVADIAPCTDFGAFLTEDVVLLEVVVLVAVVAGVAEAPVLKDSVAASSRSASVAEASADSFIVVSSVSTAAVSTVVLVTATSAPQFGQVRWPSIKPVPHSWQVFIK